MTHSNRIHSIFYQHSPCVCFYLVVYVSDNFITENDHNGIYHRKHLLSHYFQTKDLVPLRYFLGIEVTQFKVGIAISQRKSELDILEETGMIKSRRFYSLMAPNFKLLSGHGEPLTAPTRYRRIVRHLNYLTHTRPEISFAVSVVS